VKISQISTLSIERIGRRVGRVPPLTDVKTPRAITSLSILANQFSTWLSQEEVGRREVQMNFGVGSNRDPSHRISVNTISSVTGH
jgi:hypothetical protein